MKVSVVIPVWNTEQYLPACLDSVLNQTLRDLEVIAVNDGSTDGSARILADYAARDGRVRVLTQENRGLTAARNAGAAAARNAGAAAARGEWIGFVDSDDTIQPDMFERLLENGEKHHADISHCGIWYCYPDGRRVPHFGSGDVLIRDRDGGLRDLLSGQRVEPSMCTKLYRAALIHDTPLTAPVRNNEDLTVNFALFSGAQRSVFEDVCRYYYFRRQGTMSADADALSLLRDRLAAARFIAERADDHIREEACCYRLSTLVNVCNHLCLNQEAEARSFYRDCLDELKENQVHFGCLSQKQRIAAALHLRAPSVIRAVYRVYSKISLYRYEH